MLCIITKQLHMKYLYLSLFLVFLSCQQPASQSIVFHKSKIDSLFTEQDVEKFLVATDPLLKNFTVMKPGDYRNSESSFCKKTADSLGIRKSFYKADFDGNGYTDLLVSGKDSNFNVIVIMNHSNNSFSTEYLYGEFSGDCSFPKVDTIEDTPVIDYYFEKQLLNSDTVYYTKLVKTVLAYHSYSFVEYHKNAKSHVISKIEYQTLPCFGTCPIFNLVIENGKGFLNAQNFNTKGELAVSRGKYKSTIKSAQYEEITELLNYIDFPNLEGDYGVNASDMPGCVLRITYDNGKTKLIGDYGKQGTYGLRRVYSLLAELRFNQIWKKE